MKPAIDMCTDVCVKLTKAGIEIYRKHYTDKGLNPAHLEALDGNLLQVPLWQIMRIFGQHIVFGPNQIKIFDDTIIYFPPPDRV